MICSGNCPPFKAQEQQLEHKNTCMDEDVTWTSLPANAMLVIPILLCTCGSTWNHPEFRHILSDTALV